MTVANDRLRVARERTESPSHAGAGLSRDELAELVNAHVWRARGKVVAIDGNYVGKLERGKIRWPRAEYREALRSILGVRTDAALGFSNVRRAAVTVPNAVLAAVDTVVKVEDVDRQQFLRTAALGIGSLALAPGMGLFETAEPTPVPIRVGMAEVEQITAASQVFAGWDATYGGGLVREAVVAQLKVCTGLLGATYPDAVRKPLHSAIGDLADTCAYMAFDVGAHEDARSMFRLALACAEEVSDWHLRAEVLSSMARQAIYTGHPDEGLTLIEHALVRADRLTATEQAMLHAVRARALAKMGRTQETLLTVGVADDHFAKRTPANDPSWMGYYNAFQHDGDTGHALFDLAVNGRFSGEAGARLSSAASGHAAEFPRARVFCLAELASLTMVTGDPAEAVTIGTAALDSAGTIRSRRVADHLRELASFAVRHRDDPAVADLRHRINTAVLAA
ncbi:helix-turn-helix domain-containing protein [Actinokineospora spheciospongiae]|uniref:helix-turn-helix domain-containing protein n=1 Tax=Actinokineospora spheciospongiae TaxID=909613 RepID=UPI000D8F24CC|nr:helix-turn-helix transcriptional regulator [Actinokineospora spheciospongiae]PWW58402.1 hypothetical protein DFQ13_109195 [Actinokineospora spheciospongiae]